MTQPAKSRRGPIRAVRVLYASIAGQSDRTILLGTILIATAVSGFTGFVLTQYFDIDAISSLMAYPYADCQLDLGTQIGRHCFSDYGYEVMVGMRANPWAPAEVSIGSDIHQLTQNIYPAAATVPTLIFGLLGKWLGVPMLGLLSYLLVLTIAVLSPALWAARGALGLERIVVFLALSAMAVPAWSVLDRGNSVGLVAPIGLIFLIALCRQRWGLVALMVVIAAFVKPQFVVLAFGLFVVRQWRWGGLALAGSIVTNLGAYVLWPQDFPHTIMQSIGSVLGFGSGTVAAVATSNVSFSRSLLLGPDILIFLQTGGKMPEGYLAGPRSLIGYVVLVLVVASLLVLGRRIPPVIAGIVLLITASLFPMVSSSYYFVLALPVAALLVRDPEGPANSGIFDRLATVGGGHRAVGVFLSLATALTIATIALPSPPIQVLLYEKGGPPVIDMTVLTTATLMPIAWLITFVVIIVSYARNPTTASAFTGISGPATVAAP